MCIVCEMGFWDMVEALPPETRERILREEAARQNAPIACDVPEADTPSKQDEQKP